MRRINKIITSIFVVLLLLMSFGKANAQSASDLRFNEILVYNDSNCVDDFGMHSPWIEIFNSAFNSVNIGGCYLTNDPANPKKYWIPTGDPATVIPPRCYILFWADDKPTRGIFHLNFDLENSSVIELYDASGRTLIDKLEIVQPQKPDVTYGRINVSEDKWDYLDHSTPGANNDHTRRASSGESFVKMDPWGFGMALIAMSVVFSALAILFLIYKNLGKFFMRKVNKQPANKETSSVEKTVSAIAHQEISGEVNAAIAMALFLYQNEMHDYENTVLTVHKVSRAYSPWSSKIYSLRKNPR